MTRLILCGAVVLAALVSGCGGSSESKPDHEGFETVLAGVDGLPGKARTAKLQQLAQREGGQVDVYSSMGADTLAKLVDDFEDRYDIDVAVYRADGDTVLARLIEEEKAGFRGSDVAQINGLAMTALRNEDLLFPYASPAHANLVAGAVYDGWTAVYAPPFVVSWNTRLVPAAERPRKWEDLADPRWKGQLAIEASDVDWYKTLRDYWIANGKTKAEADRLFDAIGRNAIVVKGHSVAGQLHAAGEFKLAVNYSSRVDILASEGAPLAWQPAVEPLIAQSNGVGLVRGARHPAAALLFVDYVLADGQKVLAEDRSDPTRKDLVAARAAKRLMIDFDELAADEKRWSDAYDRILGRGKAAPPE